MFLVLLIGLGAAGVKAQVRIGGNTPPNPAAALDLNAAEGITVTKGLALPRVTLGSSTATLDGTTANITGMLVYNTSGTLSTGVYYWNGNAWNRIDGATLGGDTIVGNEITNTTTGGGLQRSGSGTAANPYTVGITTTAASAGTRLRYSGSSWVLVPEDSLIIWPLKTVYGPWTAGKDTTVYFTDLPSCSVVWLAQAENNLPGGLTLHRWNNLYVTFAPTTYTGPSNQVDLRLGCWKRHSY